MRSPLNNRKSACLVTELFEVPVADIFQAKKIERKGKKWDKMTVSSDTVERWRICPSVSPGQHVYIVQQSANMWNAGLLGEK